LRGRTSSRGGNTETAYRLRRECAESTEVAERVRRQYEQREHSTNVLFKYGHSTDVRDVQEDFKVRQFRLWQVIRFLHSHRALQKLPKKEDVANTRRQETTTIRATVSFFLPPLLPLLLLLLLQAAHCCGTCTWSGSLSSSEELLTSAGAGAGGGGVAACFELFALVGRVDPFAGMV